MSKRSLVYWVENNKISHVKQAIIDGDNLNKKSRTGQTPLQIAIRKKFNDIAKTLIESGANVRENDSRKERIFECIDEASFYSNVEILQFLIVDNKDGVAREFDHASALRASIYGHSGDGLSCLLEIGADPYQLSISGINAFELANREKDVQSIQILETHKKMLDSQKEHDDLISSAGESFNTPSQLTPKKARIRL